MIKELDEIQEEDDIVYHANTNGYLLLSGRITIEDLIGEALITENYCTFDPHIKMTRKELEKTLEEMISYFVTLEDYEKCSFLRDYSYETYMITLATNQW